MACDLAPFELLLNYQKAYDLWFAIEDSDLHPSIIRKLKLLRGVSGLSIPSLEDLESLTSADIEQIIAMSKARTKPIDSVLMPKSPAIPAEYFYSTLTKSEWIHNIVSHATIIQKRSGSALSKLTAEKEQEESVVHGFRLKKDEAFTSTRYYSDDKKIYGKVVANSGMFKIIERNLNDEQKIDVAFEVAFQYLLSMTERDKTICISGKEATVHRIYAAFLYLQKEAAPRYADLKFELPKEMQVVVDDTYILKHLGSLTTPPEQVTKWRQFLKLGLTQLNPVPEERHAVLFSMNSVQEAHDLSQDDKSKLKPFEDVGIIYHAKYEKIAMRDPHFKQREKWVERAETALRILNKSSTLKNEYEKTRKFYENLLAQAYAQIDSTIENRPVNGMTTMLSLQEVEKDRQTAMHKLMADMVTLLRKEVNAFNKYTNKEFKAKVEQYLHQIENRKGKLYRNIEGISYAQQKEHCETIHSMFQDLQADRIYRGVDEYKEIKKILDEVKEEEKTFPESRDELIAARERIKNKLEHFRKEFKKIPTADLERLDLQKQKQLDEQYQRQRAEEQKAMKEGLLAIKSRVSKLKNGPQALNAEVKKQFNTLLDGTEAFIKTIATKESKPSANQLVILLEKILNAPDATHEQMQELRQCITDVLPYTQSNSKFEQTLSKTYGLITEYVILDDSINATDNPSNGLTH